MLLVLIAVAAALILSSAYVLEQSTAVQVSSNIGAHAEARMAAESGLAMAVAYVRSDDNWRSDQVEGAWVQDHPFGGGTFTISAQDGQDLDGDGVVDGDGDLSDDWMDMLTLTAVGRCRGAQHTVRAVVPPFKRALMIVNDPDGLSSEDTDRYTLLREWGWRVRLLRGKATSGEFDQAVENMHVVYFAAHTVLESTVKDKLKVLSLPVVTGHRKLVKEMKMAGGDSDVFGGTSVDVLKLTRTITDEIGNETTEVYTHYITSPFPVGTLVICSALDDLLYLDKPAVGTQGLASQVGSPARAMLGILECGALMADGRPARARRLALPWGGENFAFQIGSLNANGRALLARSLDWAGSSWRGYLPGIAVWDRIEIKDMALVDGFWSTSGPYGGGNVNADCTLSTNSVGDDDLKLSGGVVNGHLFVSPDADMSKVIDISGGAALTGVRRYLSLNVPIPTPEEPTDLGESLGDAVYTTGSHAIWTDKHFNKLTIRGDAIVHIKADLRILCDDDVRVEQGGQLVVDPFVQLTLYTKKLVEFEDNARVNADFSRPAKLSLLLLKGELVLRNSAQVYAMIQSYDGELEVNDEADLFGTFVGEKAKVQHSGAFHVDTSNSGTIVTLGGGYDLEKVALNGVRWVEDR